MIASTRRRPLSSKQRRTSLKALQLPHLCSNNNSLGSRLTSRAARGEALQADFSLLLRLLPLNQERGLFLWQALFILSHLIIVTTPEDGRLVSLWKYQGLEEWKIVVKRGGGGTREEKKGGGEGWRTSWNWREKKKQEQLAASMSSSDPVVSATPGQKRKLDDVLILLHMDHLATLQEALVLVSGEVRNMGPMEGTPMPHHHRPIGQVSSHPNTHQLDRGQALYFAQFKG